MDQSYQTILLPLRSLVREPTWKIATAMIKITSNI